MAHGEVPSRLHPQQIEVVERGALASAGSWSSSDVLQAAEDGGQLTQMSANYN